MHVLHPETVFTVYILGKSTITQKFQQGFVYWYMITIILKVNTEYLLLSVSQTHEYRYKFGLHSSCLVTITNADPYSDVLSYLCQQEFILSPTLAAYCTHSIGLPRGNKCNEYSWKQSTGDTARCVDIQSALNNAREYGKEVT